MCIDEYADSRRLRELEAYVASLPADWNKDSSLETWFPFTAEELKRTKRELADVSGKLLKTEKDYQELERILSFNLNRAEKAEQELAALRLRLEEAQKDAESWKNHWQMYRDAWIRELGGWLVHKHHEIDALVLTTRKRCVNALLGNCSAPHWLGEPTDDGKALRQTAHPQSNSCKEWKVDNSEASESRQRVLEQALREIGSEGCRVWHQGEGGPTCLGVVAHAKAHPEKYDKKFHAEIMSQKYLCGPCRAESALAQGEPARTEEK